MIIYAGSMTEREIRTTVARMLAHLERLLLNRDISEESYHAAIRDISLWEEDAVLKIRGEAQ